MNPMKALCESCGGMVAYTVEASLIVFTSERDRRYTFLGREAHCAQCGEPVWATNVEDFNVIACNKEIRHANDLLNEEEISTIPTQYSISVPDLAAVLHMDSDRLQRLCRGRNMTKDESVLLAKVYNDPLYFSDLLEAQKDRIQEDAYLRSRRTVDALAESRNQSPGNSWVSAKTQALVQYLRARVGNAEEMALQKQMYYVQGFVSALAQTYAIQEDCEARENGPVYKGVYLLVRSKADSLSEEEQLLTMGDAEAALTIFFTEKERKIIDAVSDCCASISSGTLCRMPQKETPWIIAKAGEQAQADGRRESVLITKTSIKTYFDAVCRQYDIRKPEDIPKYLLHKVEECRDDHN